MRPWFRWLLAVVCLGWQLPSTAPAHAQEVEIRRWNQLPVDQNFGVFTYAHTSADIAVDPVLQLENVKLDLDTWLVGYIRSFAFLNRTARIEVRQAWQEGVWTGTLAGVPASTVRTGMDDTFARVAINLIGGPPLKGQAYQQYRASVVDETIVGVALGVQLPTGLYFDDKLINLGTNRFTFRPQLGMQHKHRNWVVELTGTGFIYTTNDDFYGGRRLTEKPLYAVDGSIEYDFDSGLWTAAGLAFDFGGQSTVDGIEKDDFRRDVAWSFSAGFPLTRSVSLKANYVGTRHLETVGVDSDTVSVGLQATW